MRLVSIHQDIMSASVMLDLLETGFIVLVRWFLKRFDEMNLNFSQLHFWQPPVLSNLTI